MAYDNDKLSMLAYANGFTLWHYTTPDAAAAVEAAGYFDAAATPAGMLNPGDMVLANTETDGAAKAGLFLVKSVSGGNVDVSDMLRDRPS